MYDCCIYPLPGNMYLFAFARINLEKRGTASDASGHIIANLALAECAECHSECVLISTCTWINKDSIALDWIVISISRGAHGSIGRSATNQLWLGRRSRRRERRSWPVEDSLVMKVLASLMRILPSLCLRRKVILF